MGCYKQWDTLTKHFSSEDQLVDILTKALVPKNKRLWDEIGVKEMFE